MTWEEYDAGLAPEPEDEENLLPVVEAANPVMITMAEAMANREDTCPF